MRALSRGATLVELLVTLSAAALLAAATLPLLLAAARATVRVDRGLAAERDLAATGSLLTVSLGGAALADLSVVPGPGLEFDRQVGRAVPCAQAPAEVRIDRQRWSGGRPPVAGRDEVLLLTADSLRWVRAGLTGVVPADCPVATPGWSLGLDRAVGSVLRVRVLEPSRLRAYPSAGTWWIGLERRLGGGPVQPIAGPIAVGGLTAAIDSPAALLEVRLAWPPPLPAAGWVVGLAPPP